MTRDPIRLAREAQHEAVRLETRRQFLRKCTTGFGGFFLAGLASRVGAAQGLDFTRPGDRPLAPLPPQFAPRAKRVIFLHMAGAPSQHELFDYKPELARLDGKDTPAEFLEGRRFAFISGVPKMLGPQFPFHQAGQSGAWISDRLPHIERHIDRLCFVKSMRTDQFNHAPAQLLFQTGTPQLGAASFGSWVVYGLGAENENLPGFVVLASGGHNPDGGKALWGSGFLPGIYQGVQCRSQGDPVLYLSNPDGVSRPLRRAALDALGRLHEKSHNEFGDPETVTRIAQHEMAFRMQISASEAFDIGAESEATHAAYGTLPGRESFANNCLLARRLAERGVRFIQLYHWGWDSHGASASEALNAGFQERCREVDQPIAALLADLDQRGLLDETLVVWGAEFGRTPMQENRSGGEMQFIGRDHNPAAFTIWMAGGGVKPGFTYGETDPIGYEVARDPVEIRDLHATMLHLLGFDHHRLSFPFQGLDQKLTGVQPARVVPDLIG